MRGLALRAFSYISVILTFFRGEKEPVTETSVGTFMFSEGDLCDTCSC